MECCCLLDFAGQRDDSGCGSGALVVQLCISAAPTVALTAAVQSKAVRSEPAPLGIWFYVPSTALDTLLICTVSLPPFYVFWYAAVPRPQGYDRYRILVPARARAVRYRARAGPSRAWSRVGGFVSTRFLVPKSHDKNWTF
eukprot:COSAG02_NODE_6572_length_3487_cov_3.480519_5_plen_141_part_00